MYKFSIYVVVNRLFSSILTFEGVSEKCETGERFIGHY
jgi:hypothetical protein